jgi:chromosomal replication initiation ATPase DnaA
MTMNQKHFWLNEPIDPHFESFYDPQNILVQPIQSWLDQNQHFHLHIHGPHLSGKTHLLYACMQNHPSVFFCNQENINWLNLNDHHQKTLCIIDDIDQLMPDTLSAEKFIELYNERLNANMKLITTSSHKKILLARDDLKSRFQSAIWQNTYLNFSPTEIEHLHPLIARRFDYELDPRIAKKLATLFSKDVTTQIGLLFDYLDYLQTGQKKPSLQSFSAFSKERLNI